MRDIFHQNFGTMTGTPTLVAGMTTDGNQALQFDGSTNSMSVADSLSDSLAIADGAAGGMALELFIKLPSIPGSTKDLLVKSGSYSLQINSAGKLLFTLTNGAFNVTVTSATALLANVAYHVVLVYNGDYTGAAQFGNSTPGSAFLAMPADYHMGANQPANLNLQAERFTALERGALGTVFVDMRRVKDATLPQNLRAVAFGPNTSTQPGKLLGQSAEQRFLPPDPARAFIPFSVPGSFDAGDVWLALISGGSDGNSGQVELGHETSGGTRAWKSDAYSDGAPNPFGTPGGTDAKKFAFYATYTPTGRTGAEGKALIYINGIEDASSAYAHGIADSANALVYASNCAVILDESSLWKNKLTPVQVMQHYSAR